LIQGQCDNRLGSDGIVLEVLLNQEFDIVVEETNHSNQANIIFTFAGSGSERVSVGRKLRKIWLQSALLDCKN